MRGAFVAAKGARILWLADTHTAVFGTTVCSSKNTPPSKKDPLPVKSCPAPPAAGGPGATVELLFLLKSWFFTVHGVTLEVDGGPIIDQAVVRVEAGDTLESLAVKVHAAEHALLPAVIAKLSAG